MFNYALSVVVLGEPLRVLKVCSVILSVGGIIVIAIQGSGSSSSPSSPSSPAAASPSSPPPRGEDGSRIAGDLLVLGTAAAYSLYEVGFAKALHETRDLAVVNAATALVGVSSILVGCLIWAASAPRIYTVCSHTYLYADCPPLAPAGGHTILPHP